MRLLQEVFVRAHSGKSQLKIILKNGEFSKILKITHFEKYILILKKTLWMVFTNLPMIILKVRV
jgi:hypothetical protein